MGYLLYNIPFFLLIAALLGFVIGWLLRGNRFQGELQDLDARWRSKLGEVESERDRFAGEVSQANEARAKHEASAIEAKRLAETHDSSLAQLRRDHQSKQSALGEAEKRASDLEKELAEAKASRSKPQGGDADSQHLGNELSAATGRAEMLERDLLKAEEANTACKREVERLEARISDLQRANAGGGDSALGLMGSAGSSSSDSASGAAGGSSRGASAGAFKGAGSGGSGGATDQSGSAGGSSAANDGTAGSAGSSSSSAPLGLVGGRDAENTGAGDMSGGQNQPDRTASSPSSLAESGSQGSKSAGSSSGGQEGEGTRPEALTQARGGVADDLKKISGVGPKLEKTLNGLGIFHFAQIAAFTPENVVWVDRHLRFKGRIERDEWIEQAKTLAAGGQTEFSQRH